MILTLTYTEHIKRYHLDKNGIVIVTDLACMGQNCTIATDTKFMNTEADAALRQ